MIINIRLEVSDEQRNALAVLNKPSAPKRLATRKEFSDFVQAAIDGLGREPGDEPCDPEKTREAQAAVREAIRKSQNNDRAPLGHLDYLSLALYVNNAAYSLAYAARKAAAESSPLEDEIRRACRDAEALGRRCEAELARVG